MRCVSTPLDTNGFGYASFRRMGHRAHTAHLRAPVHHSLFRKGRIGFVTFHQSYSYEEFVEGLRPDTGALGNDCAAGSGFSLRQHDGVFKMSLGRAGIEDHIFEAAIEGNYVVLGWGGELDWSAAHFDKWEAIRGHWRSDHPEATGNDPNVT